MSSIPGFPPKFVIAHLRVEGFVALIAAVTTYWFLGGNWWLFAVLLLAPDLSFFGLYAGETAGAKIYNLAHTYAVPPLLGAIGWFGGVFWLTEVALIWVAHIGLDRALGYGLKYPGVAHHTHLGLIGPARKAARSADAR
ncbi:MULTISPECIES: DUF4260 domain-containing protein [unclassified Devosia]|uniref:DUF4260 domain-containing protein n=1 Tax=unclassified Devosia TaxID=196773 RepID=UPI0008685F05|nr:MULTISPECIES: DUF4260 domain-containing protein [unclassified Devosia]MBN9360302.1 DUF4260 domain-containing protein [Devosia sp.]ODS83146.1 MAG: hypothetical protein ABS47_21185 [Devosia sp. SCN 66-27]OJX22326.1 MAG: hypothetical protein BGO83_15935 [Devosia sp. 66-14]